MSRAYTSRTRPAQTTRPTQRVNRARGMSEELPMDAEEDASPPRRGPVRGEGYTMFVPDGNKRQAIQRQADEEKRKHEEYKNATRPHYSYVGTVGGNDSPVETRETAVTQQNLPSGGSKSAQKRSQMYKELEKQRMEKEQEEHKKKQRQKANENEEREKQIRKEQEAAHRSKYNAWLDKLEGKSSEEKMENAASASASVASASAASASAASASATSASAAGGNAEEDENREFTDALVQLESMFPWAEKDILKSLLKEAGNDVDHVAQLLS